jgi:hypothetical protein
MSCVDVRRLVSERFDGEAVDDAALDGHVAGCAECRRFAEGASALRRRLRFEPVGEVPDVAGAVRQQLAAPAAAVTPARTRSRSTIVAAAAALAVGAIVGANLVGVGGNAPAPVLASTLPERVADAQGAVGGLQEDLRLVERGWHPGVPERTWQGTLDYRAPESLALVWHDETAYPSGAWRPNDLSLRTDGEAWSATGLDSCPSYAQPACSAGGPRERAVVDRPPFADDAPVPLELIVPVRSFTRVDTATVLGAGEVAGRQTVEVSAVAAQVSPLLQGLAPAGNLRSVHPTDEVRLSLDAERMVPLRLRVVASSDPDRRTWAIRRGYADHAGLVVLALDVTTLDLDTPPEASVVPPAAADARDAGFQRGDPGLALDPPTPAGFTPNRSGTIEGATPTAVWSWSDGRAWIRLQATDAWQGDGLFGDLGPLVRAEPFGTGEVWVRADGRRVGLHADGLDLVVDGSVDTPELVAVLRSLDVTPVDLPEAWPEHRAASRSAIRQALPGALGLRVDGFERPVGRVDGASVVLVAAGAGERGLRLDQQPGAHISQPVELDYETLEVRGRPGRYAPGSGRLEWVEDGHVLTLRGTGLTRAELLTVADGLAPL